MVRPALRVIGVYWYVSNPDGGVQLRRCLGQRPNVPAHPEITKTKRFLKFRVWKPSRRIPNPRQNLKEVRPTVPQSCPLFRDIRFRKRKILATSSGVSCHKPRQGFGFRSIQSEGFGPFFPMTSQRRAAIWICPFPGGTS